MKRDLSRRELLFRYGPASLLLVPVLRRVAARADALPTTRYVQVFVPNGTRPAAFWPDVPSDPRRFSLDGTLLEAFAPLQRKMLLVKGVQTGTRHDIHSYPGRLFTNGDGRDGGRSDGASLDWAFADRVQASASPTRFHSLQIGIDTPYPSRSACSVTRDGGGSIQPCDDDPVRVFDRVLGDLASSDCGDAPPPEMRVDPARSRLDTIRGELGAARASLGLGAAERLLLDELESGIRDLERRLPEVGAPPPPACGDADLVAFRERAASLAKAEHGRFFADLVVLAFQLDLTRVVSLTHFSEGGDTDRGKRTNVDVASWFRVRDGGYDPDGERVDTFHHHLSHYGDGAREAGWERAVNRWAYAHVAYLAMRMDELPGTTGSMLDDSLVFHLGSGGNGKTHRGENTPCLLLGSAGGAIPQGEYRGVSRARHGRAVASAAVALGVSEGAFGSEGGDPLF